MNNLDFSFEESPWQPLLDGVKPGEGVNAAQLLTLLEGAEEEVLEDALMEMEERGIPLDISQLPRIGSAGEAALRLRQEEQFVKSGMDIRKLEAGDPLRLYLEEIAAVPAFGDEQLLAEAGQQEPLVNLGLSRVVAYAAEHTGRGVLLLDLIQEGSLGLWQAICRYRDGDYPSQRDHWIRFYIGKAITMQARSRGMGERMKTAMEDYRAVDERLLGDLGRNPTLEEIALELHMTPEEAGAVRKMLDDARLLARVRKEPEPEEEAEAQEQAVEDTAQFQMRQRILDLLSAVSKEESQLLTLRFGLEGGKPLTPEETGRKLGLTPAEVVAREAAALAKLRNT